MSFGVGQTEKRLSVTGLERDIFSKVQYRYDEVRGRLNAERRQKFHFSSNSC